MVICAQKSKITCIPKCDINKITTGEQYVTVYYIAENKEGYGKDTYMRCQWVIVDGQKLMPNVNKTDEQFDEEFAEIAKIKKDLAAIQETMRENNKTIFNAINKLTR